MEKQPILPGESVPVPDESEAKAAVVANSSSEKSVEPEKWTPVLDKVIESAEKEPAGEKLAPAKPEEAFNEAVEAAEHDEAIEGQRERRAELKDKDSGPAAQPLTGVQSVGQVLARKQKTGTPPASPPPLVPAEPTQTSQPAPAWAQKVASILQTPLYRRAISYGFIAASVLLIILALARVIFS